MDELITTILTLEQSQYNAKRIKQDINNATINMIKDMMPEAWDKISHYEEGFQELIINMRDI